MTFLGFDTLDWLVIIFGSIGCYLVIRATDFVYKRRM